MEQDKTEAIKLNTKFAKKLVASVALKAKLVLPSNDNIILVHNLKNMVELCNARTVELFNKMLSQA